MQPRTQRRERLVRTAQDGGHREEHRARVHRLHDTTTAAHARSKLYEVLQDDLDLLVGVPLRRMLRARLLWLAGLGEVVPSSIQRPPA